jgi:hypothetical protein
MLDSAVASISERGRVLNAVALQNAVLCAECEVVSDSPHDTCLVCGSRSLFNIARIFGGKLPGARASLIVHEAVEITPRDLVLTFPKHQPAGRRATAESRKIIVIDENDTDEGNRGVLLGPKSR